jgi:hypothetical protein
MIQQIHNKIKNDLITNQKDLFNMQHYYTHKHRSQDRLLDINVGLFRDNKQRLTVQIYVADKNTRIRERLFLDENLNIINNEVIVKEYLQFPKLKA